MPWLAAVGSALSSIGGAAGGAAASAGSALGSAAGAVGSGLGSAASGIGSGLGSLGSTIGAGASELAGSLGGLMGGGGEAGVLSGLGQAVPAGVEMVGPSSGLVSGTSAAEAGLMFPQVMSQGTSAIPQSFAMSAPQSSGGWSQMLGQILGGQGGGGGNPSTPGGPGQQFNIMDTLSPQNIMQGLMNPASGLTKGAPPPPQMSLPAPSVPQTQPDDRLAFLRAFNSTF